jgi:hypothetical protein
VKLYVCTNGPLILHGAQYHHGDFLAFHRQLPGTEPVEITALLDARNLPAEDRARVEAEIGRLLIRAAQTARGDAQRLSA